MIDRDVLILQKDIIIYLLISNKILFYIMPFYYKSDQKEH